MNKRNTAPLSEGVIQAMQVINGHRMRSALLIVGVAIGVMTLLAIYTIASGLSGKVRDDVVSASRPYIYLSRWDGMGGDFEEMMKRRPLGPEIIEPIEALDSVAAVDYEVSNENVIQVSYGEERANFIQMMGCGIHFPLMFSFTLAEGRFFGEQELAASARVCVLGYGPAEDLFPVIDPVGKVLRLEGRAYTIVGTIEKRGTVFGALGENYIVVPWTSFEKDFLSSGNEDRNLAASIAPGWTADETIAEMTGVTRRIRKLRPGEDNDFDIIASETYGDMVDSVTGGIALVLVVLSSIGLMVGGIGVMNIMLISVTERTREIGVRMALGARRRDVLLQVLIEAGVLTGIGGVVGIIFGLALSKLFTLLIDFPFSFSLPVTLGAAMFSVTIGLVFGLYPANRAANLDPIEALRCE